MTEVDDAQRALGELRGKKDEILRRQDVLVDDRRRIAFVAHTEGGSAAKRLVAINTELAAIGGEVASLDAAIAEAERRVGLARQAAERADAVALAEEAAARATRLRTLGAEADAALAALRAAYDGSKAEALANARMVGHPSPGAIMLAVENAIRAGLQGMGRDLVPPMGPTARHSFGELCGAWATEAEGFAARLLAVKREGA